MSHTKFSNKSFSHGIHRLPSRSRSLDRVEQSKTPILWCVTSVVSKNPLQQVKRRVALPHTSEGFRRGLKAMNCQPTNFYLWSNRVSLFSPLNGAVIAPFHFSKSSPWLSNRAGSDSRSWQGCSGRDRGVLRGVFWEKKLFLAKAEAASNN